MAADLTQEILAQLRRGQLNGYSPFRTTGSPGGPNGAEVTDMTGWSMDDPTDPRWYNSWNDQGQFIGQGETESTFMEKFFPAAALALATAGIGGAFGGADGLEALGEAGGYGFTSGELPGSLLELGGAGGAATGGGAAGAAGGAAGGLGAAGGSGLLGGAGSLLGGAGGIGSILGAVGGALDSGDKEATTKNEPWGPAQPWIKQNIAQGQQLQQRYTDQPFSDAQKTGYGNLSGILNFMNTNAPSLISGMTANASGMNQFDRTSPTRGRGLLGQGPMNGQWNPGLLNYFPGK